MLEIDFAELLQSATFVDVVVLLIAGGLFVVGWLQGTIRQLIGIVALVVAFLLAANLRDPLGDFLARNWTFYDRDFNHLLAFLGLWLTFAITSQVAIQLFYRRMTLHPRLGFLDELFGGLLGAFQVFLVLAMVIAIFDPYYAQLPTAGRRDVAWASNLADLLAASGLAGALRDGLVPAMLALLGPLLPGEGTGRPR